MSCTPLSLRKDNLCLSERVSYNTLQRAPDKYEPDGQTDEHRLAPELLSVRFSPHSTTFLHWSPTKSQSVKKDRFKILLSWIHGLHVLILQQLYHKLSKNVCHLYFRPKL